jgi:hypothetical protein
LQLCIADVGSLGGRGGGGVSTILCHNHLRAWFRSLAHDGFQSLFWWDCFFVVMLEFLVV